MACTIILVLEVALLSIAVDGLDNCHGSSLSNNYRDYIYEAVKNEIPDLEYNCFYEQVALQRFWEKFAPERRGDSRFDKRIHETASKGNDTLQYSFFEAAAKAWKDKKLEYKSSFGCNVQQRSGKSRLVCLFF
ncbi:hypothetical protein RB195_001734 [Necator americanus]